MYPKTVRGTAGVHFGRAFGAGRNSTHHEGDIAPRQHRRTVRPEPAQQHGDAIGSPAVNARGEGQVLADEITRQVWLRGNDSSNAAEFKWTSVKQNH